MPVKFITLFATLCAASLVAIAGSADAACTKRGFSVNDYGKEGPARDAQNLLDKRIAEWAKSKGIKKYTTGKKTVSCELFLDFGVFDEYTCTAVATVCWDGPQEPDAGSKTAADGTKDKAGTEKK